MKRIQRLVLVALFLVGGAVSTFASSFRDGAFTGGREYAYYGFIRVRAVVQNGTLKNVQVLEYPSDNGTSQYINSVALPYLIQESVQAQNGRIDLISGATFTSEAFVKSLQSALSQASA